MATELPYQRTKDWELPGFPAIDTATLGLLLLSDVPVVVVDARDCSAQGGKCIPGASHLSAVSTADEIASVINSKWSLVVAYCVDTHCPARLGMCRRLRGLGYRNVLQYPEGIVGWAAAGYPLAEA